MSRELLQQALDAREVLKAHGIGGGGK